MIEIIGRGAIRVARETGGIAWLFWRVLRSLVPPSLDGKEILRNLHKMGNLSLPIVGLTAFFTGGIMVIQAGTFVKRFNAAGLVGWGAGYGVFREVGPILIGLMFSGRVGANNTAELGTMTVTEQIDALRALAIDPIAFLIVPRFVAIVLTLFLATLYADAVALVGAAYAGQALVGVDPHTFYNGLTSGYMGIADVTNGLIKSVIFGIAMGLSSCHFGLAVSGGAPGVGRAVNATVVASAAGIFVVDYFVSFILG
jgi:phospholipid/cholesterol/gamma-HCH transport system permease protein